MEKLAEKCFEIGDWLLAQGEREEALACYQQIQANDSADDAALERIEKHYILPIQAEARQTYMENCCGEQQLSYEECTLDFIPIGTGRYEVFDHKAKRFEGVFNFNRFDTSQQAEKKCSSILIADYWDLREMIPFMWEKSWAKIYVVLNDEAKRFMSFFKIPGIRSLFPDEIQIFATETEFLDYIKAHPDVYLPRKVFAPEPQKYEALLRELHLMRIRNEVPSNNILLSICIPSYNRGKAALKAVLHVLESDYDAEIEVLLSNNGSNVEVEAYHAIQRLRDSRVRYYEFEKNRGYAENVYNCLKKARGRFAVLLSDEDSIALENLGEFLNYLDADGHKIGACVSNDAAGAVTNRERQVFTEKTDAGIWAIRTSYVTGVCYNMVNFRSSGVLQKIDALRGNEVVEWYFHSVCCLLLACKFDVANTGIALWRYGGTSETGGIEMQGGLTGGMTISSRLAQEADAMKLFEEIFENGDYKRFLVDRVHVMFGCIATTYKIMGGTGEKLPDWTEICIRHYKNCLKILDEARRPQSEMALILKALDEVFLDWLDCRRIKPLFNEEETLKSILRSNATKYLHSQGNSFLDINFKELDKHIDVLVAAVSAK